ncbi:MAG TPA: hypothetical protein VGF55_16100 [Gemmataceae bacterium]|jgi:hypothetical protein
MFHDLLRQFLPRPGRRRATARTTVRSPWRVQQLEDRTVPATIQFATGSGPGVVANQVNVFLSDGSEVSFNAFPGFNGGVRVATGDATGDGITDVVVAAGPGGGPHVKIIDGAALTTPGITQAQIQALADHPLKQFFAYDAGFAGGVFVAVGDINGDGFKDVITGADAGGGPHVKVFNTAGINSIDPNHPGPLPFVLYSFFAYDPNFHGGVRVAAGNVGGDNGGPSHPGHPSDELITGAGPGGGPHVRVFSINLNDSTRLDGIGQFFAYTAAFTGGVYVGSGVVTNNFDEVGDPNETFPAFADIITGAGPGGGPHVIVWRLDNGASTGFTFRPAASFFAYPAGFTGGVTVGTMVDSTHDNVVDFVTGAGPGGGPHVRKWLGQQLSDLTSPPQTYTPGQIGAPGFFAYDAKFTGGVYVG